MILTRTSLQLGAGSGVLAVAGFLAGYPELVLLGAAGLTAVAAAAGWVAAARFRLAAERGFTPGRPTAGQTLTVRLHVANRGPGSSAPLTVVETVGGTPVTVRIPAVPPGARNVTDYQVPDLRRGRLRIERAPTVRRDPLGLARAVVLAAGPGEIRVRPHWHPEVEPLSAPGSESGPAESGLPRGDVVFHSLRDYRPGDPARLIHWQATARRGGTPVVRELADLGDPAQILLLDTATGAYRPYAFEDAVRIAASLAVAASRHALALELHTTGDGCLLAVAAAEQHPSDPRDLLDALCDLTQTDAAAGTATPLADAVAALARSVPSRHGSAVLGVVCGHGAESAAAALRHAAGVFAAVYLIRVGTRPGGGTGAGPAAGDAVVRIDTDTSRHFAAAAAGRAA